jgi:hypothetical protein
LTICLLFRDPFLRALRRMRRQPSRVGALTPVSSRCCLFTAAMSAQAIGSRIRPIITPAVIYDSSSFERAALTRLFCRCSSFTAGDATLGLDRWRDGPDVLP